MAVYQYCLAVIPRQGIEKKEICRKSSLVVIYNECQDPSLFRFQIR